jgi:hypothetical protein
MNKPRPSVLELFDPLKTPATSRNALNESTGSSDSEKENVAPPKLYNNPDHTKDLAWDLFLKGSLPKRKHKSPVKLRQRLVDVGDATVDDIVLADIDEGDEGDDEGMSTDSEVTLSPIAEGNVETSTAADRIPFDIATTPKPPPPRPPLSELDLSVIRIPRKTLLKRSDFPCPPAKCLTSDTIPIKGVSVPTAGRNNLSSSTSLPHDRLHQTSGSSDVFIAPSVESDRSEPSATDSVPSSKPLLLTSPSALPLKEHQSSRPVLSEADKYASPSFQMELGDDGPSFNLLDGRIEIASGFGDSDSFVYESTISVATKHGEFLVDRRERGLFSYLPELKRSRSDKETVLTKKKCVCVFLLLIQS